MIIQRMRNFTTLEQPSDFPELHFGRPPGDCFRENRGPSILSFHPKLVRDSFSEPPKSCVRPYTWCYISVVSTKEGISFTGVVKSGCRGEAKSKSADLGLDVFTPAPKPFHLFSGEDTGLTKTQLHGSRIIFSAKPRG